MELFEVGLKTIGSPWGKLMLCRFRRSDLCIWSTALPPKLFFWLLSPRIPNGFDHCQPCKRDKEIFDFPIKSWMPNKTGLAGFFRYNPGWSGHLAMGWWAGILTTISNLSWRQMILNNSCVPLSQTSLLLRLQKFPLFGERNFGRLFQSLVWLVSCPSRLEELLNLEYMSRRYVTKYRDCAN